MILQETFDLLQHKYHQQFEDVTIEKVQVGIFLTAVKLSTGYCGVASSDLDTTINCCHKQKREFGIFTPGNISGKKVLDLFNHIDDSKVLDRVKHAVLNAVSAEIIAKSNYRIIEDSDPFDLLDISGRKTICLVGAFQSYIKRISNTQHKLYVLELNENALADEHKQYYVPSAKASEVLPNSDIVIITGLTIANNTLDDLLTHIPSNRHAIIVGPTSGLIPDILFKHNISIIGSTRITDPERMFTVVSEGGAGFHLFKYCAQKICILNE